LFISVVKIINNNALKVQVNSILAHFAIHRSFSRFFKQTQAMRAKSVNTDFYTVYAPWKHLLKRFHINQDTARIVTTDYFQHPFSMWRGSHPHR
jgi:hypothetical protein